MEALSIISSFASLLFCLLGLSAVALAGPWSSYKIHSLSSWTALGFAKGSLGNEEFGHR